jgi:hypothetical protein
LVVYNSGQIHNSKSEAGVYTQEAFMAGGLVGDNRGIITASSASGSMIAGYIKFGCGDSAAGGLAGYNEGHIVDSFADISVDAGDGQWKDCGFQHAIGGGLVGYNSGTIEQSFAMGEAKAGYVGVAGGLVGKNSGTISDSYSLGRAIGPDQAGGLIGLNLAVVSSSYSVGKVAGGDGNGDDTCPLGGLIGCDYSSTGKRAFAYWDLETSGISDPHQGAGNVPDDPGIVGISDAQLKTGLPDGFDPNIWGQSPSINNGYPYLLANPPQ